MATIPHKPEQRILEALSALSYRTGELSRYLQEIAQSVSNLIDVDWAVVTICHDGWETVLASSLGLKEGDNTYSLHGFVANTVIQTGHSLAVEDTLIRPECGSLPEGYRAYLGVPLRPPHGNVIGTVCAFHRQPRCFTAEEIQLVELFAERAATAIDNYQLYQQQQQINQQLQAEIRDRQEVEQALRESEARFRALVEQAVDAFFLIDETGRFLDANQRALNNLGYTREELLTLHASDVQKRFPPGGFAEVWQCLISGQPVTIDGIHQRKDGTTFPVEVHCGLVEWGGRKVELALVRDITERKQAEEALRQSEEKFRQLAENMHQVVWMYSHHGKPLYLSPAFETIWGQPYQHWYDNPDIWWQGIHPEDRERVRQAFFEDHEGVFEEEYRIIRPDGTVRLIRDQAFPIRDEAGQIYRIAGIAEDITERKQAEQEMLKAIAALAEVGELAAMIVHEVRNPLTTVLMGLNSIKRLDLPETVQERLNLSLEEAERIRNLLKEILLYAKPQALQRLEIELNAFITEILEPIRTMPSAMSRRIEFISARYPIKILGDRDKLKQVFINLVDNACQAIAEGEVVTWAIAEESSNHVCIRIHNGGDPIPPEILPKLIKPFYTTKATGTGLGLAIVKRIVEAHDGELSIESSAETGTVVKIRLPLVGKVF